MSAIHMKQVNPRILIKQWKKTFCSGVEPIQYDPEKCAADVTLVWNHISWMVQQIEKMCDRLDALHTLDFEEALRLRDKINRWIGCVQMTQFLIGGYTINELRKQTLAAVK